MYRYLHTCIHNCCNKLIVLTKMGFGEMEFWIAGPKSLIYVGMYVCEYNMYISV